MGLVAHSAAKDASLRIGCGVVAGGDEQRRGDLDADAEGAQQRRVGPFAQAAQLGIEVGDLCCQCLVAASQGSQRFFGCRCHGFAVGAWSQPGANLDQLRGCEPSELVLEALGGSHSHRVDLVGGNGAGLYG